jgi:hypothetical protein
MELIHRNRRRDSGNARTATDGRFRVDSLSAGQLYVIAKATRLARWIMERVSRQRMPRAHYGSISASDMRSRQRATR